MGRNEVKDVTLIAIAQASQTARPRGTRSGPGHFHGIKLFQSARPWGTRSSPPLDVPHTVQCFNPRVRGGRDVIRRFVLSVICQVSIRASVGDAIIAISGPTLASSGFNPRVRGGRDITVISHIANMLVSIRASVGDAISHSNIRHKRSMFQSARPWGTRSP